MSVTKFHISKYGVGKENINTNAVGNDQLDPEAGKWVKVALASGDADDFAFAWQNPESSEIIVDRVILDITHAGGSASAVMDVGSAASGTTHSDNLIDGVDINTTAVYDNLGDGGTNGKTKQKLDENGGTTDYITGQILDANAASLEGNVYIHYRTV